VRATRAAISEARRFNFDESIRLATTALKENPDFRAALLIRAEAAIKCGDLRTAYVDLKRAADESAPADIRLLLTYLNYLLVRVDDEAIVEMQMGLDFGLSEAQLRNNLGFCHLLREELQPAVAELHRVTKLDPGFAPGWLNLAVADLRISLKKPEDRPHLDYIENAVALSPASLDIRRVAVDVYVRDVWAGGTTRDALERHCAAAIRHGVPLADIVKALVPLAEDLRDSILKDLSDAGETRDDQQVVRTMRFVSPCDVVAVATSLLEQRAD
jgi:tetratricopeptide (TPR) repeat protein